MLPELLVPAGDMDSAKAAVNGGADAIYLGGKSFSARSFAKNFADEEIENLIDYALLRGVKIYIAVNTLYKNDEIPRVLGFVNDMYKKGASAFILQDIGLAYLLKNHLPEIEMHASTQMTVHSLGGARFMREAGFSRVILSRELSLEEILLINKESNIETEVFAHGALCISYSGQCLMSSMVGGRSGNRGKCAQPCRLAYELLKNGKSIKSGYLLSPKDMMTLDILDALVKSGISALKIEGRMKSPEYVYIVTKAYRERLDTGKTDRETLNNVTQIFNRGGSFSTGYYHTHGSAGMMSTLTPKSTGVFCGSVINYKKGKCTIRFSVKMVPGDGIEIWVHRGVHVGTGISKAMNKNDTAHFMIEGPIKIGDKVFKSYDKMLFDETKKARVKNVRKTHIFGEIDIKIGKPMRLILKHHMKDSVIEAASCGNSADKALNAPISKDEIIKQLSKTGNSPFIIKYNSVKIDEHIYISKLALNELRRNAVEVLESEIIKSIKRQGVEHFRISARIPAGDTSSQKLTVQIRDISNLNAVLEHNVSRIYIDFNEKNISRLSKIPDCRPEIFLALPSISRNEDEQALMHWMAKNKDANFVGYLVSTHGHINILNCAGSKKKVVLDYHFNILNNWSKQAYGDVDTVTLSQELNIGQLKNIDGQNSETIVYGRQVLMSTHNCPIGLYDATKNGKYCSKRFTMDKYSLLDRKAVQFPILPDCNGCIAYLLNSKILDTANRFQEIKSTGVEYLRLIFRDEDSTAIKGTIEKYERLLSGSVNINNSKHTDSTYGHFFRGVD